MNTATLRCRQDLDFADAQLADILADIPKPILQRLVSGLNANPTKTIAEYGATPSGAQFIGNIVTARLLNELQRRLEAGL